MNENNSTRERKDKIQERDKGSGRLPAKKLVRDIKLINSQNIQIQFLRFKALTNELDTFFYCA